MRLSLSVSSFDWTRVPLYTHLSSITLTCGDQGSRRESRAEFFLKENHSDDPQRVASTCCLLVIKIIIVLVIVSILEHELLGMSRADPMRACTNYCLGCWSSVDVFIDLKKRRVFTTLTTCGRRGIFIQMLDRGRRAGKRPMMLLHARQTHWVPTSV